MTIHYWTSFSKRDNSTKQPNLVSASSVSVVWKEDTSIEKPSLILSGNSINIDYVFIDDWNKYYFVDSVTILTNGLTQYDLSEDCMATRKTEIGNTKAMILRSSSSYNVWIPDDRVYVSTQKTIVRTAGANSVYFADSTGCYLFTVVNKKGSYSNFAAQYYDNATGIQNLADRLLDSTVLQDLVDYYGNVGNAIVSLQWMPFDFTSVSSASTMTTLENIEIANNQLTTGAYRITGSAIYVDGAETISIPWRGDNDFRETAPYTVMKLLVPMYGIVDLNTSDLVGASNLYIQYRVDRTTGDVIVIINADSAGAVVQTLEFNVAVEMPVATLTRNIGGAMSAISGGINSAIGIAAGNYIGGTMGVITSAANFALNANGRSVSATGSINGKSKTGFGDKFQILAYAPHTLDPTNADFIATNGRPLQAVDSIGNHSGYILCENASVDLSGDTYERNEINRYLNSGFYYE